jgi:hypothetical protein
MNREVSEWAVGWTMFAAVMMIMLGVWWIIAGLVAIIDDTFYVVTQEWIFEFNRSTWGWIHLIMGIVVLFGSFGLFRGDVWARVLGVILAVLSGLVAFSWMPYYPVWGILFIALSIAVIWALTAHGEDITRA